MKALQAGTKAPSVKAKSTFDKEISTTDYVGKQNVLLVFYPAAFTPV